MQCRSCAIASGTVNPRSSAAVGARRAAQSSAIAWISGLCSQKAPMTDDRRRNPTEALDLSGDRRGPGFWEEGSIELSCGGVPLFDGLARSRFHPRVATTRKSAHYTERHAPHCTPKTAVSTPLHLPLSARLDEISCR
jgi:hypothetical protein